MSVTLADILRAIGPTVADGSKSYCEQAADMIEAQAREIEELKVDVDSEQNWTTHYAQKAEELRAALVEIHDVTNDYLSYGGSAKAVVEALTRCKEVLGND